MTAAADEDRLARATLTCLAEPGDVVLGALLRTCDPARIVAALTEGRAPSGAGRVAGLEGALRRWGARLGRRSELVGGAVLVLVGIAIGVGLF